MRSLALVDDPRFDEHFARGPHPERPERLHAARSGLEAGARGAVTTRIDLREATDAELAAVHRDAYVRVLRDALGRGYGMLDADTFHSPGSRDAAWLAAGGAAALGAGLGGGSIERGVALLRPPGHHAEPDRAMGFCLLNNVAIAARAALSAGATRVAIVDWDVHHGNGTQRAFEDDPDVLFVSLHQSPLYPGTGRATEVGRGAGRGATANLALPESSGPEVYGEAFRRVVLPLLKAHRPDVILVSAGFDAHARDPLAGMELDAQTYGAMSSALVELAESLAEEAGAAPPGRVAFVLEGGYDLHALEASVEATVKAALGARVELPEGRIPDLARRAIEQTRAAVEAARGAPLEVDG